MSSYVYGVIDVSIVLTFPLLVTLVTLIALSYGIIHGALMYVLDTSVSLLRLLFFKGFKSLDIHCLYDFSFFIQTVLLSLT